MTELLAGARDKGVKHAFFLPHFFKLCKWVVTVVTSPVGKKIVKEFCQWVLRDMLSNQVLGWSEEGCFLQDRARVGRGGPQWPGSGRPHMWCSAHSGMQLESIEEHHIEGNTRIRRTWALYCWHLKEPSGPKKAMSPQPQSSHLKGHR